MILQRLAEHYDRIAVCGDSETSLAPPGFSMQKISFCIVINQDGSLNSFQPTLVVDRKKKFARPMIVPGEAKPPGQGLNPCFLWDNASYLLGWDEDPKKQKRARACFEALQAKYLAYEKLINHAAYSAVCSFLREWSPEKALEHQADLKEITSNFGVFRIAGQLTHVHDHISLPADWSKRRLEKPADQTLGMCLVTGHEEEIARLHKPAIKGVSGSQTPGAFLASYNAAAFESYRKSQSFNAPVGITTVFKYSNALNHLLNQRDRRVTLGDATVVFWADQASPFEDGIAEILGISMSNSDSLPQEDRERLQAARSLLVQLKEGFSDTSAQNNGVSTTNFYILGLSPNASRLSVRFWMEADASKLSSLLGQHLRDIDLAGGQQDHVLTLRRMVKAAGRAEFDHGGRFKGYDAESISPQLAGEMARAVLVGAAYPQSLIATMLRRIHSDGAIFHPRVAAIKGVLVRNSRLRGKPLEVTVNLNPAETSPGYLCGRLFFLLEKVQSDSAGGQLNSTIKDRFFSSASVTPSLVFPRLFRLSQHHLAKLENGQKIYFERQIGEVMSKIDRFPHLLALEDQGNFVIGYFHQRQDTFTSRKDKEQGAAE